MVCVFTQGGIALAPAQAQFSEPYTVEKNQGNYSHPQALTEPKDFSILSNCYAYVKTKFHSLPSMDFMLANATTTGTVALFIYAPTEEFPNGLPHVALVVKRDDETVTIRESHYHGNSISERTIAKNDTHLIGFFTP